MGKTPANGRLADLKDVTIKPFSSEARDEILELLLDAAAEDSGLDAFLRSGQAGAETVLAAFTLSEYLRDIAVSDPVLILDIAQHDPADYIARKLAETRSLWRGEDTSETALMAALRKAKKAFSLAIALYDLARIAETRQIVAWWSQFAEAAIGATSDFLLLSTEQRGAIVLHDRDEPSRDSGFFILGMGKLGARELNYSSDIDLVAVFNPAAGIVRDPDEASNVFSKLVRSLVRILQERTPGGYVFRTDLRLRPDPGATPVAISYNAALVYYEARGQNWERAAYIKARPVAGDLHAGNAFCRELTPFVFRKYLDYATIADIHSIKRQIHAHKGLGNIAIRGHNVKLGRGGIREIEFFVQTQQLIAGGRAPELRVRSTDDALTELARFNWVDQKTEQSLRKAYWYLRDVENRIQMRRDEQQHAMPESDKGLRTIALMMGYEDTDRFVEDMLAVLNAVQKHYSRLFEHEKELSSETGNLVFTGDSDDPGTIETLSMMGFERPSDIARIIRTWHSGRYNATRSSEARERLTELMPTLLKAFSETKRADEALIKFDEFLSRLPAGIQLFSLLQNNQNLCSLIVSIMASAPRLSETISRRPHVFDGVIDRNLLSEMPVREYLADRLAAFLKGDFAYEEILDRLRIFAADQKFLIGVRLLTGAISGDRASQIFSDLADLIMDAVLDAVCREFESVHGCIEGGQIAVVGMGKLGSMEMTASSDIDIIVLYAHAEGDAESDGKKPLDAPRYYARLTQRLVAALSSPTAEGVLYDVDLRLRPSGNKGPIASSLTAFSKYQFENAWTWEHMALTRARIVAGDEELAGKARSIINEILTSKRDPAAVSADIHDMRARILEQKPPESIWDIKLIPGGLIDIEFIGQYLSLIATAKGFAAPVGEPRTLGVLKTLAPQLIGLNEAEILVDALTLYTEIMQIVRLCLKENYDPDKVPAAFDELLLGVVGMPDMAVLENKVRETAEMVNGIFASVIRPGPDKPRHGGKKKAS